MSVTMSVTKDSIVVAVADVTTKWPSGVHSGCLALTNVLLVFSFYYCTLSMIFIINK